MTHRAYLFIGPPASGKGTHGKVIGQLPGFIHFSMGAAFRKLRPGDPRGEKLLARIQSSFTSGELVPDEIVLEVFRNELERLVASGAYQPGDDRLLLDGIPRTAGQAAGLAGVVEVLVVFKFVCSRAVILERVRGRALEEGRADDAIEILERRLDIYEHEIEALMSCYPSGQVIEIDSTQPPARVLRSILEHMG